MIEATGPFHGAMWLCLWPRRSTLRRCAFIRLAEGAGLGRARKIPELCELESGARKEMNWAEGGVAVWFTPVVVHKKAGSGRLGWTLGDWALSQLSLDGIASG